MPTHGVTALAVLLRCVLCCSEMSHVCPHPQWVWTQGLGRVMGRKLPESVGPEGGEGRAGGGEGEGANGGQVVALAGVGWEEE